MRKDFPFSGIAILTTFLFVVFSLLAACSAVAQSAPRVLSGTYSGTTMTLVFSDPVFASDSPDFFIGGGYSSPFWIGKVSSLDMGTSSETASDAVVITLSEAVPAGTGGVYVSYGRSSASDEADLRGVAADSFVETFSFTDMEFTGDSADAPAASGLCGSTLNVCTTGTFKDTSDSLSAYHWICEGGRDDRCELLKESCSVSEVDDCSLEASPAGEIVGVCADDLSGECAYRCHDGSWEKRFNSCGSLEDAGIDPGSCSPRAVSAHCTMINSGHYKTSPIVTGSCIDAHGSCSYRCLQDGNWERVIDTCTALSNEDRRLLSPAPTLTAGSLTPTTVTDLTEPTYTFTTSADGYIARDRSTCLIHHSSYEHGHVPVSAGSNSVLFRKQEKDSVVSCKIIMVTEAGKFSNAIDISYTVTSSDTIAPTLTEVTAISSPSTIRSPSAVISSSEKGKVSYSGSCTESYPANAHNPPTDFSRTYILPDTDTDIYFFELPVYARDSNGDLTLDSSNNPILKKYNDCVISVTDSYGNEATLTLSSFTVDWKPVLSDFFQEEVLDVISDATKKRMREEMRRRNGPISKELWNSVAAEVASAWRNAPLRIISIDHEGSTKITIRFNHSIFSTERFFSTTVGNGSTFLDDFTIRPSTGSNFNPTAISFDQSRMVLTLPRSLSTTASSTLVYTQNASDRLGSYVSQGYDTNGAVVTNFSILSSFSRAIGGNASRSVAAPEKPKLVTKLPKTTKNVVETDSGTSFTRDLSIGSRGEDVRALQRFLNAQGYLVASSGPGSSGSETTYFGALTQQALVQYQAAENISPAAGYFGPITRAHIADSSSDNDTPSSSDTSQSDLNSSPPPVGENVFVPEKLK